MILAYKQILDLLKSGAVLGSDPKLVNGSSLDIRLGETILKETKGSAKKLIVALRDKIPLHWQTVVVPEFGYVLEPGEFILAQSMEMFNLPLNLSAQYFLKSSMARIGINHSLAGWCDPGWNNSVLTLEFQNMSKFHSIRLFVGDAIGQMVFHYHQKVPLKHSYIKRGGYNNSLTVRGMK